MDEDFLEHFGVKGMKWGVRRNKDRVEVAKSSDHNETRAIMKKPVSAMSNAELQRVNTRRQLETQYSNLNPRAISRGEKFAKGAMGTFKTVGQVVETAKTVNEIQKSVRENPLIQDLIKETRRSKTRYSSNNGGIAAGMTIAGEFLKNK